MPEKTPSVAFFLLKADFLVGPSNLGVLEVNAGPLAIVASFLNEEDRVKFEKQHVSELADTFITFYQYVFPSPFPATRRTKPATLPALPLHPIPPACDRSHVYASILLPVPHPAYKNHLVLYLEVCFRTDFSFFRALQTAVALNANLITPEQKELQSVLEEKLGDMKASLDKYQIFAIRRKEKGKFEFSGGEARAERVAVRSVTISG